MTNDYYKLPEKPKNQKRGIVPWYGLTWKEIQEKGFIPQIEKHLIELTELKGKERAADYLKFLREGPINNPQKLKTPAQGEG